MPLGSVVDTDNKYKSLALFFESNNYKVGLAGLDSIFNNLKRPTQFDCMNYYNIKSYYSNWDKQFYKQIAYADSAIQVAEENKTQKELAIVLVQPYINKANAYFELNLLDEGYSALFKGYDIANKYGTEENKNVIANNIAMKMYEQKQYDSAAAYFKKTLMHNTESEAIAAYKNNKTQELLDNIGLCYTHLKKTDSAVKYYNKCITFLNQPNLQLAIDSFNNFYRIFSAKGVVKGNMAKAYLLQGNKDSAIALYKEAISINDRPNGDIHDMQTCIIQLCNVYLSDNKPKETLKLLAKLKQSFGTTPSLKHSMECEHIEYNYYQQMQQPVLALQKLKNYLVLKDSLDIQEQKFKNQDINKELKEREQQLQISLLKKDNQLSKTYSWAFAVFSFIAVIIAVLVFYYFKKERKNFRKQAQLNQAILEQKKEIEQINTDLDASNKQKEKLMNIMAHELRSPISGISAVAQTLLQDEEMKQQSAELVAMIEHTSSNTLALINELLEEKNKQDIALHKSELDINNLIKKAVLLLQFKANEKQQKILETYATNIGKITVDADKIERVIINLITNAIKFSEAKKNIEVSTTLHQNFVRIIVKDKGVGMSETQLKSLFDAQKIMKRTGTMGEKSFGLGLSICKQIIEKHNGKLWAESIENAGSSFIVELPLHNI